MAVGKWVVILINELGTGGITQRWDSTVCNLRQSLFSWQKIQINHADSEKELTGEITEKCKERPTKDRHDLIPR